MSLVSGYSFPTGLAWQRGGRILSMSTDEIEAEALKLDPQARARLAKKLLESLETLSDPENERLWAEEADPRDAEWDSAPDSARPAADVLRAARAKLK
jgi:Putative addiction module component